MTLELRRRTKTPDYTIGDLYIGDTLFCQTMEDTDRGLMFQMPLQEILEKKVYGKTAIPVGVYELVFNYSAKFKKELPLLLNVPGYVGIRIHPGNFANYETYLKNVPVGKVLLAKEKIDITVI